MPDKKTGSFYPNISLKKKAKFSYQLKEGISNDRLGYLILKREKVIELLEGIVDITDYNNLIKIKLILLTFGVSIAK